MNLNNLVNLTPHCLDIEIAEGGTISIPPTMAPCRSCEGCGVEYQDQDTMAHGGACTVCKGTGSTPLVARVVPTAKPEILPALVIRDGLGFGGCPECGGDETRNGEGCWCCHGTGAVEISVSIPRVREAEGRVEGLPQQPCPQCERDGECLFHESTPIYVVSRVVADHPDCRDRGDVWSPGELIRATPGPTAAEECVIALMVEISDLGINTSGAWEGVELIRSLIAARQGQPIGAKGLRR